MANKKTSQYDAVPAGSIASSWIYDISAAGVKNYKGTHAEVSQNVAEETITGLTTTSSNIIGAINELVGPAGLWEQKTGYIVPITGSNEIGKTADRIPAIWSDDIKSTAGNIADVSFSGAFIDFDTAPAAIVKFSTVNGVQFGSGQNINEIVTSIDLSSTNKQSPTAKAVFDAIGGEDLWDEEGDNLVTHTLGRNIVTDGDGGGAIANINDVTDYSLNINVGTLGLTVTDIEYDPTSPGALSATVGEAWQSFTPTKDIWCPGIAIRAAIGGQNGTFRIYEGEGIAGTKLYESDNISIPISGMNDVPFARRIFMTSGSKYTWSFERSSGGYNLRQKVGYAGGTNNAGTDFLFKIYEDDGIGFKVDNSTAEITAEKIALASGIVQVDAAGLLSSSTDLPNGTTSTTQTFGDNTTKNATTAFVQSAVSSSASGEKDVITVGSDGQVSFPGVLSQTPSNTDTMFAVVGSAIFDYGNAFTVSGTSLTWLDPDGTTLKTTDRFYVIYDYDLSASGSLDQIQFLTSSKAGDDLNNGKSIEKPFLDLNKLLTEANLVASSGTPYKAQVLDGGSYTPGAAPVGSGVRLHMESSKLNGGLVVSDDSEVHFNNLTLGLAGTGFYLDESGTSVINGNRGLNSAANPSFIIADNGGTVFANMHEVDMDVSGGKTFDLTNSSSLHMFCNKYTSGQASSVDATSVAYIATPSAMYKDDVKIIDTETGYFRDNTKPGFKAIVNSDHVDVTGDATPYPVVYQNDSTSGFFDLFGNYNNTTGKYTASVDQLFCCGAANLLGGGIVTAHSIAQIFVHKNSGGAEISRYSYSSISPFTILDSTSNYIADGSTTFKMSLRDTVECIVIGSNSGKSIDVKTNSQFWGYVETAL